jgi:tetratricopeptide (TPR) repeat protein
MRDGQTIALPPKAFDALHLFVRSHGNLVSRAEITQTLWPGIHVIEANLTNIVVLLRKTLGRDSIQTVSRFGYRFTPKVTGEPGVQPSVYEAFLRGRELLAVRTLDSIRDARDLFLYCVAEDPQFAAAWAWLGRACRLVEKFRGERIHTTSPAEAAFQRAFRIDPDLGCAHHFYTQLQVDSGRSTEAVTRLASRLRKRGEEPETLAGLVQTLRCCGLLHESVAAHRRAIEIEPTFRTSVAHTYFLLGDYPSLFETYIGRPYYLDVAAWVALGQTQRAMELLRTRLAWPDLGPFMTCLMASLLAILECDTAKAASVIQNHQFVDEPEGLFYLARHGGLSHDVHLTIDMIRKARLTGFWSSRALEQDTAFASVRDSHELQQEIEEAKHLEDSARKRLREELGTAFVAWTV